MTRTVSSLHHHRSSGINDTNGNATESIIIQPPWYLLPIIYYPSSVRYMCMFIGQYVSTLRRRTLIVLCRMQFTCPPKFDSTLQLSSCILARPIPRLDLPIIKCRFLSEESTKMRRHIMPWELCDGLCGRQNHVVCNAFVLRDNGIGLVCAPMRVDLIISFVHMCWYVGLRGVMGGYFGLFVTQLHQN